MHDAFVVRGRERVGQRLCDPPARDRIASELARRSAAIERLARDELHREEQHVADLFNRCRS